LFFTLSFFTAISDIMFRFILGAALLGGVFAGGFFSGRVVERLADQVYYVTRMLIDGTGAVTGVQYVFVDTTGDINFVTDKQQATPLSVKDALKTKKLLVDITQPMLDVQFGLESESAIMQTA
jgi:hypothetical protein